MDGVALPDRARLHLVNSEEPITKVVVRVVAEDSAFASFADDCEARDLDHDWVKFCVECGEVEDL